MAAAGSIVDAVVSVTYPCERANPVDAGSDTADILTADILTADMYILMVRALVFHHHPAFIADETPGITARLKLCGLPATATRGAVAGASVTRVGNTAANFWPMWWADQHRANLSHAAGDYTEGWSVQGLRHHFGPCLTHFPALHRPSRAVRHALLGGHADGMLIGGCNPMV